MDEAHFTQFDKTVEARIGGWIQQALEISGCKDVEVATTKSLTKGDSLSEYRINWA